MHNIRRSRDLKTDCFPAHLPSHKSHHPYPRFFLDYPKSTLKTLCLFPPTLASLSLASSHLRHRRLLSRPGVTEFTHISPFFLTYWMSSLHTLPLFSPPFASLYLVCSRLRLRRSLSRNIFTHNPFAYSRLPLPPLPSLASSQLRLRHPHSQPGNNIA